MFKLLISVVLFVLLSGCASKFAPTDKMLQLKQGMNTQQATDTLKKYIKPGTVDTGFCWSKGVSVDKGTPIAVTQTGYSMQAYNLGELVRSEKVASGTMNDYKKIYYLYERNYKDITQIRLLKNRIMMSCQDVNKIGYSVNIYYSVSKADTFIVPEESIDEIMAAIMTVAPQAKLIEGVGL